MKYVYGTQNGTWSFETKQYEFSTYPGNNDTPSDTYGLFGWGDAPTLGPVEISTSNSVYSWPSSGAPDPWGSKIDNNGTWRTLSSAEWTYLFNTRTFNNGANTGDGYSYQRATINSDATSVYGVILYPDNYTLQTGATSYTSAEWSSLEEYGCVFLPAAGRRYGSSVGPVGDSGSYWSSSTAYDSSGAYYVDFNSSNVFLGNYDYRSYGCSVRLITDVK